jgi:hypothetical protein
MTHLSQRARRHAGKMPNLNGPARPLYKFYNRPDIGPNSAVPEIPLRSNVSTQTRNQDTLKFRRIYSNR